MDLSHLVPQQPGDELLQMAHSFGLGLIIAGIMFSIVGWGSWRYGRKRQSGRHMLLGVTLMIYPYFVSSLPLSLLLGFVLSFFIFWPPL
ncbi:MAG: hypothetical protein COX62_01530 [Deltaproteobacteria bacterium CG_4_10_14_0_2_um_filter_43_8]|nr:MAG: hypothetical protein COV43_09090 [Deltaproteobacteria bacterium CG11_big_fil_rev_8_21_14_0_20_42_23]PJA21731.1 MAG: hypothetical protein COX62_01530 [Deltaproteobacteria bacterium CG_4_10_14_0_2_um_filter_43_8]PJC63429.1 MAG: hypothetical protein CO021_09700 [Deltaproteobacteria bacterium CG_4_9_14_0_2_um_filter_42_21]